MQGHALSDPTKHSYQPQNGSGRHGECLCVHGECDTHACRHMSYVRYLHDVGVCCLLLPWLAPIYSMVCSDLHPAASPPVAMVCPDLQHGMPPAASPPVAKICPDLYHGMPPAASAPVACSSGTLLHCSGDAPSTLPGPNPAQPASTESAAPSPFPHGQHLK